LNPILKIADSLRIRGLTTSTSIPAASEDVMMMTDTDKDHIDDHQIIHAFPNSKPSEFFANLKACLHGTQILGRMTHSVGRMARMPVLLTTPNWQSWEPVFRVSKLKKNILI
jgi:hypothetical protein